MSVHTWAAQSRLKSVENQSGEGGGVVREKEKELEGKGWEHLITHIANTHESLKQSESNENYEMKNIRNDNKQIINNSEF